MTSSRQLHLRKRIALVAHDNKKKDLIDWAVQNRVELARHELLATGTTGKMMEENLDRPVKKIAQWSPGRRPADRRIDSRRRNRYTGFFLGPHGSTTS